MELINTSTQAVDLALVTYIHVQEGLLPMHAGADLGGGGGGGGGGRGPQGHVPPSRTTH